MIIQKLLVASRSLQRHHPAISSSYKFIARVRRKVVKVALLFIVVIVVVTILNAMFCYFLLSFTIGYFKSIQRVLQELVAFKQVQFLQKLFFNVYVVSGLFVSTLLKLVT